MFGMLSDSFYEANATVPSYEAAIEAAPDIVTIQQGGGESGGEKPVFQGVCQRAFACAGKAAKPDHPRALPQFLLTFGPADHAGDHRIDQILPGRQRRRASIQGGAPRWTRQRMGIRRGAVEVQFRHGGRFPGTGNQWRASPIRRLISHICDHTREACLQFPEEKKKAKLERMSLALKTSRKSTRRSPLYLR